MLRVLQRPSARRPRRVLMVARLAPPEFTGAGLQAVKLAAALRRDGWAATVLTTDAHAVRPRRAELDGVPIVRWPVRRRTTRVEKFLFSAAVALHLLAHPRRYAVVHLHGAYYVLRTLALLKPLLGFRVVYKATLCGNDDARCIVANRGSGILDTVDRWACVSGPIEEAARDAGIDDNAILRVSNGVDLEQVKPLSLEERAVMRREFGVADKGLLWTTVGAIARRKRIDLLVEAWATAACSTASPARRRAGARRRRRARVRPSGS